MSRSLLVLSLTLIIAVAAVFSAHAYRQPANESAMVIPSRTFEFAYQNPAKRDYFFGVHDTNRIFFTYGRDVRLSPEQKANH